MSPKEVWKNLYHQIRWVRSKQEEKEIKRNKIPTQLKPEQLKEAKKNISHGRWDICVSF